MRTKKNRRDAFTSMISNPAAANQKLKPGADRKMQMESASVSNMTSLMSACQEKNIAKVRDILQEDEVFNQILNKYF